MVTFSPRTRGCSPVMGVDHHPIIVFPACSGMFRYDVSRLSMMVGFPAHSGMFRKKKPPTGHRKVSRIHFQSALVF